MLTGKGDMRVGWVGTAESKACWVLGDLLQTCQVIAFCIKYNCRRLLCAQETKRKIWGIDNGTRRGRRRDSRVC